MDEELRQELLARREEDQRARNLVGREPELPDDVVALWQRVDEVLAQDADLDKAQHSAACGTSRWGDSPLTHIASTTLLADSGRTSGRVPAMGAARDRQCGKPGRNVS